MFFYHPLFVVNGPQVPARLCTGARGHQGRERHRPRGQRHRRQEEAQGNRGWRRRLAGDRPQESEDDAGRAAPSAAAGAAAAAPQHGTGFSIRADPDLIC